jgi:8-oxo-dGTP pyrophosphatase MutT (NUDIX family)
VSFESELRQALSLELPYAERPPRQTGTLASVLLLFGEKEGQLSLLLTKRGEAVGTHQGQMAFPGGVCEPEECAVPEGRIVTALRETEEEVGIAREYVRVLGCLPGLWTVTDFWVTPVVGVLDIPVEQAPLRINPDEIAEAAWIPLEVLKNPGTYRRESRKFGAVLYPIHVFQVGEFCIWGATGSMIRNLLDRLAEVSA